MDNGCKEMCPTNFGGNHSNISCSRPAKKDGYCLQHHPDSIKKREVKANDKWRREHLKEMLEKEKHAIRFLENRGYHVKKVE